MRKVLIVAGMTCFLSVPLVSAEKFAAGETISYRFPAIVTVCGSSDSKGPLYLTESLQTSFRVLGSGFGYPDNTPGGPGEFCVTGNLSAGPHRIEPASGAQVGDLHIIDDVTPGSHKALNLKISSVDTLQ